ncbi:asparagine synthase (glutamine-hydrolyzing) [Gynuella sunshinyii]|uniref:asparagine synthase (glutamine-hydrolyzing) n=1 Tax=Gynuella sunshinyii YC6258 TaxID=1445510 RepID=A0A0C5VQK5_9GAMM|nr:asparagine synthase (glutamine-hydrolyzing) [Gynuella sunshinyii]AJQ96546.1 asparagine synthase (glutamine-hydrolyzing) [Gynuella sunshinyii YC6258]
MCGIFGVFGNRFNQSHKREIALRAIARLDHRGPDAWGIYSAPLVTLGHTRLSIVDVTYGHQPMTTDHTVISYNGEIYNHIELREELQSLGVQFNTRCDTEVILRLYEHKGTAAFAQLNGQFSIILWDKQQQKLILARDRLGIRPLYVLSWQDTLFVSSEMKAFDGIDGFTRQLSPSQLFEHALLWNTLSNGTIYDSIHSVESGTFEEYFADGRQHVQRYYQIGEQWQSQFRHTDFDSAKRDFQELLADSVRLRLRSDVPVGAYLSGGIDSTVIAHIVQQQTGHEFSTFSVAFADDELDESYYQQLASREIGSSHKAIKVTRADIEANLAKTIQHTERPIFRTAPVPLHLLSKTVQQNGIKVVLTGEGADEILFGYDTFKELKILDQWRRSGDSGQAAQHIKELYPHLAHYADPKQFGLMKMYYEGFLNEYDNELVGLNIRLNNNKIIANYFNKDWELSFDKEALLEKLKSTLPADYDNWSLLQKNSFLEIKTLLQGYLLSSQGDRMAMSHSIEGRFPFLDHRVIEMAFALPDEFKLNGFDQKHLLKECYKHSIPEEITRRPKRPYMAPDLVAFFDANGHLTEMAESLLSPQTISDYGLFDPTMVSRFLRKFSKGVPENTGYRDNMIFIFMLTSQLCQYWIKHTENVYPDYQKCTVDITDDGNALR